MADKFVTLPEIRKHAKQILPRDVWNFGAGGAESETTRRRNRRAVDRLAIRQDVLVDVREIDLRTSLLGLPLSWPVAIAPMGGLVLFHPEGDKEMGRGAAQADTLQFLSGATGWSVEDVAKASSGPKMFQLYHTATVRGRPICSRGWRPRATILSPSPSMSRSTAGASGTSSTAIARARRCPARRTRAAPI